MCSILVVVADIFGEQAFEVSFVHRDDVVQQVPSTASYPALRHAVLPRASNEVRTGRIFRDRTAAGTSSPYFPSRSNSRKPGGVRKICG
jgi:hypothetical protein